MFLKIIDDTVVVQDPLKSRNPEPPQLIKGTGGKTAQGGSTLHSFMAKQIAVKNKDDHIDPRERILRHAQVTVVSTEILF